MNKHSKIIICSKAEYREGMSNVFIGKVLEGSLDDVFYIEVQGF